MAHTLKQDRTIMVTKDGFKDMPFDIAHFRIIPYENTIVGKVKFEKQLSSTLTSLLSDRKETFKNEFELTYDIFLLSEKQYHLFGLIGLKKYKGTINKFDKIQIEGKYQGGESINTSISAENSFKTMEKLGYIKFKSDIIMLTEKGNAFVDFLIGKDVDCYKLNEQVFVENYVSFYERRIEKT